MFKRLFFGLFFLIVGLLLATALLINPFGWGWIGPIQHQILAVVDPGHEASNAEGAEGQLWTCGMHPQVIQDGPGSCPICGMALTPLKEGGAAGEEKPAKERKIKHWVAPMDPTYISDQPGTSPMGMELIPVYEEEEEEDYSGIVHIDPGYVQNFGVQTVVATRQDIPFEIRTIGTVNYNEKQIYLVNTKYSGWIEDVQANYVGEAVRKGQKLFEIYSPELVTTQKEHLAALDYVDRLGTGAYPDIEARARALVQASRERLRNWDLTDDQIRELTETREPRRTLTVYSPVSGVVLEKMGQALEGMYVRPGMNLYRIVDLSTVWVDAEVYEHQLPWLKLGQGATLEFPALPGQRLLGQIRFVYPYFSQKSRTMKVSIEVSNPSHKLRADMYADVFFEIPSARGVLTVPESAVIHSGRRNVVVLDRGEGAFQVREIELGVNGEQVWEVKSGIREGDKVVISSQFLIDSESNLREAIQKMIETRNQAQE